MSEQKQYKWKYKLMVVLIILFIISALVLSWLNQESKLDPASEKIIREAAAAILNKDPNDLTDDDFVKITAFSTWNIIEAQQSGVRNEVLTLLFQTQRTELSDIRLLEKFTNLQKLQLRNVYPPEKNIPKWMKILAKCGIYDLDKKFALDLSPLKKLKNLQSVLIDSTPVRNYKPLSSLKDLRTLSLLSQKTLVKDKKSADLEFIKNLTKLEVLHLIKINISDTTPIRNLTNLRELQLVAINTSDIKFLTELINLRILNINSYEISDLEPIKNLMNLQSLELAFTQISNLKPLNGLTNLKQLRLVNVPIQNIKPLESLTNLEKLELEYLKITDFEPIKGLSNLQDLHFRDILISDLEPLKELKNLTMLQIENCEYITDEQVEELQKALPNLKITR